MSNDLFKKILELKQELSASDSSTDISNANRKKLLQQISELTDELEIFSRSVDLVRPPEAFFDPTNPEITAGIVSLALIAQDRQSLEHLTKFYGAGIYALYYTGNSVVYSAISGSETPIYIGKASPKGNPKTFKEQGPKLFSRLNEHKRNIEKVSGIMIADFEYRYLAVQSGFESAAEDRLISTFKPIWNKETNLLFGIGKHGDSAKTRQNNKSPFDTVHPGRKWAEGNSEKESRSDIIAKVQHHLKTSKIYKNQDELIKSFLNDLKV